MSSSARTDSGLMRRSLGRFSGRVVASPDYLAQRGTPQIPADLAKHDCLRQRWGATGKLAEWPLIEAGGGRVALSEIMSANTIGPLVQLAEQGFGIALLPPFVVSRQIEAGILIPILDEYIRETGEMAALWPTSRQLSPRIRVFVDFLAEHLKL